MTAHARPFTTIAAVLFLLAAALHAFRLYAGFQIILGSHVIPVAASWAGAGITLLLGVMLLRESRR